MKFITCNIVMLVLFQLLLSCNTDTSVFTETGDFILKTENPQAVSLQLENKSQEIAAFVMKLNNGFFYDIPDITAVRLTFLETL